MTKTGGTVCVLGVLAIMLCVGVGYGQSGVYDRAGNVPGHGIYSSVPEETVDLFTGNLMLAYRDIFLPGPEGLSLGIWRVYNSKVLGDGSPGQGSVQAYPKSMLGLGWSMHMGILHQATSNTPVVEFPDGRRETAYPDNYGVGKHITKGFLKLDKGILPLIYPKLYFQNGIVWTFSRSASIPLAGGGNETVYLVTSIQDAKGNSIQIEYDPADDYRSISSITDAFGRVITFHKAYNGGNPARLTSITLSNFDKTHDVTYSYSVSAFVNGYYRLDSFTPPCLSPTTFEYNDGTSDHYELDRVTTSFGGVMEFTYANHTFYMGATQINSRVLTQKRITFNPGEQARVWNFSYPTYQGVTTGTTTVDGPEFDTSVTHKGYDSQSKWDIGLMLARTVSDGSLSAQYAWIFQQISATSWTAMGIDMGTAKGPLLASITTGSPGDSTIRLDLTYRTTPPSLYPKRYGLPTRIATTINGAANPKSYKDLTYFYETHSGYFERYILSALQSETDSAYNGTILKRTVTTFFEETGKWGAPSLVQRLKASPSTYLTWTHFYNQTDAIDIYISVNPPGTEEATGVQYLYGVPAAITGPTFTKMTRTISPDSSSVLTEFDQSGGVTTYSYDDLGRVLTASLTSPFNPVNCSWQPGGANQVTITQGQNSVTKYWDGMGRDLGHTEAGDGTTLYSLKTLDAEGRLKRESKGSVRPQPTDPIPEYSYELDAAGRPLSITDPVNKTTHVTYTGTSRTVTDPENHATTMDYGDLPGAPTTVTDALNHAASYAYDAVGRLKTVDFNGTSQSYFYDGLDNVTSESHPETGTISYLYNTENRLGQKTWGGSSESYTYNTSGQLATFSGADQVTYQYDDKGRIDLVTGSGWSRYRDYNIWGSVTSETHSIPGLGSKTVAYGYDGNNILNQVTYPDGRMAQITNNGLGMPETLAFNAPSKTLISAASYGPGKQLVAATIAGNGTAFAASYHSNGALNTASLTRGGTSLFQASYSYDGAGNITGISSTAPTPTMSATFGYDVLNRLTSATYTSGRVASIGYSYDAYGNMLSVQENGATLPGFPKTYSSSNQVQAQGYTYDARGNLTSSAGRNFYWDAQNRLMYLSDVSGQIVGDYRYDDRGLRFSALLPVSDIDVTGIPTGGNIDITSSLNTSAYKTLTIRNLGHASLTVGPAAISGQDLSQFSVDQQPGSPVAPGGSTTLVVKFLPTSSGSKTALLSIPSNDPDENPYVITLSGYCEPHMDVLEVGPGETYDFGTVLIGEYAEATFTVKNFGSANLVLYGPPVALSGPGLASFTVTQQATSPLAPNVTSTFKIRFAPNSQGQKIGSASVTNNDPDMSPYVFTVTGTGDRGQDKIIDEEAFTVTAPAGGEEWAAASIQNITWTGGKNAKTVKIEYSPDNGSTFSPIVEGADNIGVYPWKVPPDLSHGCLVRISDAGGALATPLIISYEFNFKVSSIDQCLEETSDQEPAHFTFRAAVPDMAAQVSRVANVSFGAGRVSGAENLLFNDAVAEIPAEDSFLGVWHHACVRYDMRSYSGSVWIDEKPIISGISLNTETLGPEPASRVVLNKTRDTSVSLWIDDMEVGFLDLSDPPSRIEAGAYGRLFRDHFSKYENPSLLAEGGWRIGAPSVDLTSADLTDAPGGRAKDTGDNRLVSVGPAAGFRAQIDDSQFTSKPRAMRLEPEEDEPSHSIAKQVSFPVRVPFAVSADSFSIVEEAAKVAATSLTKSTLAERDDAREISTTPGSRRSLTRERRDSGNGLMASSGKNPGGSQPTSGETAKVMSASPAGGSFYIYSFDGRLLAEYNLYGQCVRDYIYMGAQLVAEYRPSTSLYYYYASDQINSTRMVTDDAGAVIYSAAHDPYGGIQRTWVNAFDPALKFSGKERDGESGLDYFGARYYDKSQYRFISADPVMTRLGFFIEPHSSNLYSYCNNNPIALIDHTGKWPTDWHYRTTYDAMKRAFAGWELTFAESLAKRVANACMNVDFGPKTTSSPYYVFTDVASADGPTVYWVFPLRAQRKEWHFPSVQDWNRAWESATTTLDPEEFGKALHVLQDFFCHAGYDSSHAVDTFLSWLGMGWDPDNPLHFGSLALAAAYLTMELCAAYEQRLSQ